MGSVQRRKLRNPVLALIFFAFCFGCNRTPGEPEHRGPSQKQVRTNQGTEPQIRAAQNIVISLLSERNSAGRAARMSRTTLDCGPGIWADIEKSASHELLSVQGFVGGESRSKSGVLLFRRALKTVAHKLEFWKLVLAKYSASGPPIVRKASEQELEYYAATSRYDFPGPLVAAEVTGATLLFLFIENGANLEVLRIDKVEEKL